MEMLANPAQVRQFIEYLDHIGMDYRTLGCGYVEVGQRAGGEEARISAHLIVDLMDAAARIAQKPHFALEFVEWLNPRKLGVLGLIGDHCSSLEERHLIEQRYLYLENSAVLFQKEVGDNEVKLLFDVLPALAARSFQFLLGLHALNLKISRILLGEAWAPIRLDLPEPATAAQARIFRKFLRCEVRFGAERFALVLRETDYRRRARTPNPEFLSFIETHLSALAQNWTPEFEAVVANLIRVELPGNVPTLKQVANRLAMTDRALQRKLKARGTKFGIVLRDVRAEIVKSQLAKNPKTSLNYLAYCIGYSEPSAVCRFIRQMRTSKKTSPIGA